MLGLRLARIDSYIDRSAEERLMREHLVVTGNGQITLPAEVRRRYGITPGDVVILDDRSGQLTLKPAAVVEVERYTDQQISAWDAEDQLSPEERERILARPNRNA